MGTLYPAVVFYLALIASVSSADEIQLPAEPLGIEVPIKSSDEYDQNRERLRRRVLKESEKLDQKKKLSRAIVKPPRQFLYRYSLTVGMNRASITLKDPNYGRFQVGANQNVRLLYRFGQNGLLPHKVSYVSGVGGNFFSGTGRHSDRLSRFGYSYIGPVFGVVLFLRLLVSNKVK